MKKVRFMLKQTGMGLRHAGLLGLMMWYLMLPPFNPDGSVNTKAPLTQWQSNGSWSSAAECADSQSALRTAWFDRASHGPNKKHNKRVYSQHMKSRCVSSDDPGLKAK
jgi:hypothetical protein